MISITNETCCFTGHRNLSKDLIQIIEAKVIEEIEKLIVQGINHFMAGGAIGFDTIAAAAQSVLNLKSHYTEIKLILAIPCEDQAAKWNYEDRNVYEDIKENADKVIYLSKKYEKDCMLKRNRFMVDNSNFIIGAWDGRKKGGTYYTLNYAKKSNKEIILLDYRMQYL